MRSEQERNRIHKSNEGQLLTYDACSPSAAQSMENSGDSSISDAMWIDMLREQNRQICGSRWDLFSKPSDEDPKLCEIRSADIRLVCRYLQKSYARRSDTWIWAIGAFVVPALLLIPVIGNDLGILFSIITAFLWTLVHRVRRL